MGCHNREESPAETVAAYVVRESAMRHGTLWLGSRAPGKMEPDVDDADSPILAILDHHQIPLNDRIHQRLKGGVAGWADLIRRFQLKGVREDSRQGLLGWLEGRYPLLLTARPPSPEDLLALQCAGQRVVTLHPENNGPIGRHAGPFEFLLHDLEHAHKFFGDRSHAGQRRFFNLLRDALDAGLFAELQRDIKFRNELDYLMADMNSHPLHLLKYLKAIVLEALPGRHIADLDRFCDELFRIWRLPPQVSEAARKINYPALESNEARLRVSDFFTYT